MAVLNLRDVPDDLARELRVEAAQAEMGVREYCVAVLSSRKKIADDLVSGVIDPKLIELHQEIAKNACNSVRVENKKGGGTPDLPPLGKAQEPTSDLDYEEYQVVVARDEKIIPAEDGADYFVRPRSKDPIHQLGELLREANAQVQIGLRAQGHWDTVERMRADGKTWDKIGDVIGWAGHAVEQWYAMEVAEAERANCPDCIATKKHAYSDATTPGFFYTECEKHRRMPDAPKDIRNAAGVVLDGKRRGKGKVDAGSSGKTDSADSPSDDGAQEPAVGVGEQGLEEACLMVGSLEPGLCPVEIKCPSCTKERKMRALRDICAGAIPVGVLGDGTICDEGLVGRVEVDLCGFKSYNEEDGENYICGKEVHGPKVRHGEWIKV